MCESGTYEGALGGSKEKKKKKNTVAVFRTLTYILYIIILIYLDTVMSSPYLGNYIFLKKKKGFGVSGSMRRNDRRRTDRETCLLTDHDDDNAL
jgi:hypothetical protein